MTAFLGQIGGREIDDEALARKGEADGVQRRPHPLAAFRHRLVAQPHHMELHLARDELRLDIHGNGLDPLKGHRCNA